MKNIVSNSQNFIEWDSKWSLKYPPVQNKQMNHISVKPPPNSPPKGKPPIKSVFMNIRTHKNSWYCLFVKLIANLLKNGCSTNKAINVEINQ